MNELEIINFQSHLHSYLEFHKGVNIIRGTSNYGKSSLVRAIKWAVENEPAGAKYRNWDKEPKDGFESHLSFNEGTVSRIHRTSFNGYLTNDLTSHIEEEFEALRGDVPVEVENITRMDESNLWGQDDGYFLIKDSPGNVARKLNERAGLEDIDKVSKITKGMLEDYANKVKWGREGLEKAIDREEYLLGIEKYKETIEDIDSLFRQRDITNVDMREIQSRLYTIREIQKLIDNRENTLKAGEAIASISAMLDRRLKIAAKHTKLRLVFENIDLILESIEQLNAELKAAPIIHDLQRLIVERTEGIHEYNSLIDIINKAINIQGEIDTQKGLVESYDFHINELREELDKIDMCPYCGSDKKHWKHDFIGD